MPKVSLNSLYRYYKINIKVSPILARVFSIFSLMLQPKSQFFSLMVSIFSAIWFRPNRLALVWGGLKMDISKY